MAPELRSKREKRRVETKEDIRHLLEEIYDFDPEETFYKIFSKQAIKGIQDSMNLSKEELKNHTWIEDNSDFSKLEPSKAGKVRSLKNCNAYQESNGDFPSDPRDLRFNSITPDY